MKKKLVVIFAILTYLSVKPALAVDTFNFTTSPDHFEITSTPGQTLKKILKIKNNSQKTERLKVAIDNLKIDQTNKLILANKTASDAATPFFVFDETVISLPPNEWISLPFNLNIPTDARFSYHDAIILTSAEDKNKLTSAGAKLEAGIAIPVLITINRPGAKASGNLQSFTKDKAWFESPPVIFQTTFKNTGNVLIKPRGNIFITDWAGKTVDTLEVNHDQALILPDQTRTFETTWHDSFNWTNLSNLRIGPYQAHLVFVLATEKRDIPFEAIQTFWVIPWKLVLMLVGILLFSIVGITSTFKNLFKKIGGLFILFFFLSLLVVKPVQAAETLDITLSPSAVDLTSTPGGTVTTRFKLRNNANTVSKLKVDVVKFDNKLVPHPTNSQDDFTTWLKVDPKSFQALPHEWQDITVKINVPPTAALGYYYGLEIGIDHAAKKISQGANLETKVLLPLLLTIDRPGATVGAKISSFTTLNFITEFLPIQFKTTITNTGNIGVKPRGNIFIKDKTGNQVGLIEVNENQGIILPGGSRTFDSSWSDGFIVKTETETHVNWNKLTDFRFGKYQGSLVMVYDNGKRDVPLEAKLDFWVIPYTTLLVTFACLIFLIALFIFIFKFLVNREVKKRT